MATRHVGSSSVIVIRGISGDIGYSDLQGLFKGLINVENCKVVEGVDGDWYGRVRVNGNQRQIDRCIQLFSGTKWKGRQITLMEEGKPSVEKVTKKRKRESIANEINNDVPPIQTSLTATDDEIQKRKKLKVEEATPTPAKKSKVEGATPAPAKKSKVEEATLTPAKKSKVEGATPAPAKKSKVEGATPAPAKKSKVEEATPTPAKKSKVEGATSEKKEKKRKKKKENELSDEVSDNDNRLIETEDDLTEEREQSLRIIDEIINKPDIFTEEELIDEISGFVVTKQVTSTKLEDTSTIGEVKETEKESDIVDSLEENETKDNLNFSITDLATNSGNEFRFSFLNNAEPDLIETLQPLSVKLTVNDDDGELPVIDIEEKLLSEPRCSKLFFFHPSNDLHNRLDDESALLCRKKPVGQLLKNWGEKRNNFITKKPLISNNNLS